jgi:hypothetical protein
VAVFAIIGGYFGVRLIRDRDRHERLFDLSHLLMSAVMVVMPSGWSVRIPAALQITVFTAIALWYVYLAMFHPAAIRLLAPVDRNSHHTGRPRLLYHAAMMLAMVWMAVIMAPVVEADAVPMSMHDHLSGASPAGDAQPAIGLHPWSVPISTVIGIAFVIAALWYLARFVLLAGSRRTSGPVDPRRLADLGSAAVMAAGMALATLVVME